MPQLSGFFFFLHLACISRAWYPWSFSRLVNPSSFSRAWYPLFTHNLSTALGILFLFPVICTRKLQFPRLAPVTFFLRSAWHPLSISRGWHLFAFSRVWQLAVIFFECLARCSMLLLRPRLEVCNREEKSLRHVAMVARFLDDNKPKTSLKSKFALFQTSSILFNFI